jgi:ParB-like chromosome segregation protein Spo0J
MSPLAERRPWLGSSAFEMDQLCGQCGSSRELCSCGGKVAAARALVAHPIAALFPDLSPSDFDALKEDIRRNGVKIPILLHGGVILDGRQRYRACRELGVPCPSVEWNGVDPWLEVQSRNLLRRQLAAEQVYAIRLLAARRFPELADSIAAERAAARARKAQASGQPRGVKALSRSRDRLRESADGIGAQVGVSGSTVKRIERLARDAPQLLPRVAAGEMSVRRALRETVQRVAPVGVPESVEAPALAVERATSQICRLAREACERCPRELREELLLRLQREIRQLLQRYVRPSTGRRKLVASASRERRPGKGRSRRRDE